MQEDRTEVRPGAWLWSLPFVYAIHIADEFFVGTGLYTWVGELAPFSAGSFVGVNVAIILLVGVAAFMARLTHGARFLAVAVFTQFALHGLVVHPAFSIWAGEASPGLATGILLLLPLAYLGFRWASSALPPRSIGWGVAAGALLFASQDLWRVMFNVLYPPAA